MANGDIQYNISDDYLQQFNRPIGISGMQKLQQFPFLQKLGYNGQLGSMKNDFHGLLDFKAQLTKYSSVSRTLRLAWALIQAIVPNNVNISSLLISPPGLGQVGNLFQSVHNFGQVFALSPSDLTSPATVAAKVSVFKDASIQANVIT